MTKSVKFLTTILVLVAYGRVGIVYSQDVDILDTAYDRVKSFNWNVNTT